MKKITHIFLVLFAASIVTGTIAFAFPGSKPKKAEPSDAGGQHQMPANISHGMEKAKNIIAARVNGTEITMFSVLKMMRRIASTQGDSASQKTPDEIKQEALDRLIFHELAFQKAQSDKVIIDKKEVDNALSSIKTRLKGEAGYNRYLEREMLTEKELMHEIEKSLLLEKIFSAEVIEKTVISEDEIVKAYEQNKSDYKQNEKMLFTDVVFFLDINNPSSLTAAENTLRKINEEPDKNPHNLSQDESFVVRDVEINNEKDKERERELYETAKTLKKGAVSDVILTSDSLHIIKLVEYTPEKQFQLEEVRDVINNKLRSQALQKRQQDWEKELRRDAKIEIIEAGEKK